MYYFTYSCFYLVSLLPMRALYFIADGIYFIVYYLFGYRREVVMNNLLIAFPEKTEQERIRIAKQFYRNFIDSFIEVIKLISASDSFLQKRFSVNMDVLEELYKSGKSCQLHLGHTFNWEWGQLVLSALTPYKLMVVYMPISNKVFEKLFYKLRTRSGNIFLPANNMREAIFPHLENQYLLGLVADQNPGKTESAYWFNFFDRPTPFVPGPEKGARANNLPVVFAYMEKPRRGYYHAVVELATPDASQLAPGKITLQYVRYLENVIRRNPSMWLWSHRRWKHKWKDEYESAWIDNVPPPVRKSKQEEESHT
ncbi:MAG: lysophospholipid acyltransferase family protein [Bacteroidetes bacterium]|nr:lysophospholipid acyltransferase family protein [Bacteroidota bacterium]